MTSENQKQIILSGTAIYDFDLAQTFECGQCFRWNKNEDESYTGVAHGRVITVSKCNNTIVLSNCTEEDYKNIWKNYFDLDRDYHFIKSCLSKDAVMRDAISCGSGIRILKQDVFECLLSFIFSANNNIPRIKGIIERFCRLFGNRLSYNGADYYTFPAPGMVKDITLADLAELKAGYRAKYIIDAIHKLSSGEICLDSLARCGEAAARKELMKIKGVGQKVADCVLLFGLGYTGAFPADVWIKRIMEYCYQVDIGDLQHFADQKYADHKGFAQQYLFYYAREYKIGK